MRTVGITDAKGKQKPQGGGKPADDKPADEKPSDGEQQGGGK